MAEGTAGGGEDESLEVSLPVFVTTGVGETLEDSADFIVHREQTDTMVLDCVHDQCSPHDQHFFVDKGQVFARFNGS